MAPSSGSLRTRNGHVHPPWLARRVRSRLTIWLASSPASPPPRQGETLTLDEPESSCLVQHSGAASGSVSQAQRATRAGRECVGETDPCVGWALVRISYTSAHERPTATMADTSQQPTHIAGSVPPATVRLIGPSARTRRGNVAPTNGFAAAAAAAPPAHAPGRCEDRREPHPTAISSPPPPCRACAPWVKNGGQIADIRRGACVRTMGA